MKLDPKALEAAHEAYCTFGQRGHLRAQRLYDGVLESAITAYLSTIAETHVVVPRQPTQAMLDAGWEEVNKQGIGADGRHHFAPVYAAMIASSQQGGE